jgi:hypothetical protein
VGGTNYIWTSLVNSRVDHESRRVQQADLASIDDFSAVVHKNEIGFGDEPERLAEGVHPEAVGIYWVSHGDVACNSQTPEQAQQIGIGDLPATPSSKPYFAKTRKAAAKRPLR